MSLVLYVHDKDGVEHIIFEPRFCKLEIPAEGCTARDLGMEIVASGEPLRIELDKLDAVLSIHHKKPNYDNHVIVINNLNPTTKIYGVPLTGSSTP